MKILTVLIVICAVAQAFVHRLSGRIVGGREFHISKFPYQASVRYYDQHTCGGSIINANTILTAAHCVYGMDNSKFGIRIGHSSHAKGKFYPVTRVIQNTNFDFKKFDQDMAILKLESDIIFNSTAQPISLQPKDLEVPVGSTAWVSGWGLTSEDSEFHPSLLHAVNVSVISSEQCSDAYEGQITPHMLCTQSPKQDACQGDSGGPLVFEGRLIGVVSWGLGCARPENPGVYAKVSKMYDWIVENIN